MLGTFNIFSFRCPGSAGLWPASGGIGGTRSRLIRTPSVWERVVVLGHDIAVGGFWAYPYRCGNGVALQEEHDAPTLLQAGWVPAPTTHSSILAVRVCITFKA